MRANIKLYGRAVLTQETKQIYISFIWSVIAEPEQYYDALFNWLRCHIILSARLHIHGIAKGKRQSDKKTLHHSKPRRYDVLPLSSI